MSCEKVPLLAPSGSTITLTTATNALSASGTAQIVAQVLEAAGTPPHSGTVITFTTTLGTIQPATATTDASGGATVQFVAGNSNGAASITASSGGATTGSAGALRILVGSGAVGSISLSATPNTIPSNGGTATIAAGVVDINGNALPSVPVRFSTTAGTLGSTIVTSDASGNALTTLTTSVQATVTATVGVQTSTTPPTGTPPATGGTTTGQQSATVTVNVNPVPTVSITAPSSITAVSPVVFTITVTPGTNSTAQIRDVSVDFGDGSIASDLGGISGAGLTVQHSFPDVGGTRTYTVRVTVVDTLGGSNSAATVVVVQPQTPLTLSLSKTSTPSGGNTIYTLSATVTPSSAIVSGYVWVLDDTTTVQTGGSNQLVQTFPTGAVHTIKVTVTTTSGSASATVVLP